jgi:hypothetical protein
MSLFDSPITNRAVPKYGEEGYEEFIQDFKEYEALVMQLLDEYSAVMKEWGLCFKILPMLLKKYPSFEPNATKFKDDWSVVSKEVRSLFDHRWTRTMAQWSDIIDIAKYVSSNAAAKKYPGVTLDGKNIRLSTKRINDMKTKAHEFRRKGRSSLEGLIKFCALVKDIVSNDEELIEAYRRFEQDHDKMREKQKKESETNPRQYRYTYYYVRHYDKAIYKKQKKEGKKTIDGRKECYVKASDFPI